MMLRIVVSFLFLLTAVFQGCAGPGRLPAVPLELQGKVVIPGVSEARYRPAQDLDKIIEEGKDSIRRELADRKARGFSGPMPPSYFLAVSGGGDNGAFGAGLLNGWTKAGTRPEFKLATGVSTGAIIAPFTSGNRSIRPTTTKRARSSTSSGFSHWAGAGCCPTGTG